MRGFVANPPPPPPPPIVSRLLPVFLVSHFAGLLFACTCYTLSYINYLSFNRMHFGASLYLDSLLT